VVSSGLPGAPTEVDSYDENGRLVNAGSTSYEYDAANNLTKIGTTANKFSAADELTESGTTKYSYDEEGERTKTTPSSGSATSYGYNEAGQLTSVNRPAEGSRAKIEDSYAYNGDGLRASQTVSGATSYLSWDTAEGLPLLLSDGSNSYVYGPKGLPIEVISSGEKVLYLHHDQQGSTRLLTGSTGLVEGSFTYGAYGALTGSTGSATTPLGYDGQYTNPDTGLIYMRARSIRPGHGAVHER
jgi:YD repeat-containing protein